MACRQAWRWRREYHSFDLQQQKGKCFTGDGLSIYETSTPAPTVTCFLQPDHTNDKKATHAIFFQTTIVSKLAFSSPPYYKIIITHSYYRLFLYLNDSQCAWECVKFCQFLFHFNSTIIQRTFIQCLPGAEHSGDTKESINIKQTIGGW